MKGRKCAKCLDRKRWTPAEEFKGQWWHWRKYGDAVTALAKRCMKRREERNV